MTKKKLIVESGMVGDKLVVELTPGNVYDVVVHQKALGKGDLFQVAFQDEFGNPLRGEPFEVMFERGDDATRVKTDNNGVAEMPVGDGPSSAEVRIADEDAWAALKDTLKPLWDECPRAAGKVDKIVKEGDDTSVTLFLPMEAMTQKRFSVTAGMPRRVCFRPYVHLARMLGMYFDTNKCFLLPSAVYTIRNILKLYEEHPDGQLLIAGHTDTSGEPSYNDPLSVERAESLAAYLKDDVDAWLDWYKKGKPEAKRWGENEDRLMIMSLLFELDSSVTIGLVERFQKWHNELRKSEDPPLGEALTEDDDIGPKTRKALVQRYMAHDGTTLPESITVTTFGCGENFPLDDQGLYIDPDPVNPDTDQVDRRVEMYFFSNDEDGLGIQPKVPGKTAKAGSTEYPEWRGRARIIHESGPGGRDVFRMYVLDYGRNAFEHKRYEIEFNNGNKMRGITANEGIIEGFYPPDGTLGTLKIYPLDDVDDHIIYELKTGTMEAPSTPAGASTRLADLSYYMGPIAKSMTEELTEAVKAFQTDMEGLEVSGTLDDDTWSVLEQVHDTENKGNLGSGSAEDHQSTKTSKPAPVAKDLPGGPVKIVEKNETVLREFDSIEAAFEWQRSESISTQFETAPNPDGPGQVIILLHCEVKIHWYRFKAGVYRNGQRVSMRTIYGEVHYGKPGMGIVETPVPGHLMGKRRSKALFGQSHTHPWNKGEYMYKSAEKKPKRVGDPTHPSPGRAGKKWSGDVNVDNSLDERSGKNIRSWLIPPTGPVREYD